jgi:hypothetical protein
MAEDRFEYGLAALLDGFEARLAKARAAGEAAGEAPGSAADTAEGA